MRHLLIKNWAEFQHYKKRNPPWIKLHRAIVDDYHFAALKDKTKAHLVMIWILAAGSEGRIPHDAKFIASRINATEPIDIDAMIGAGFLIAEEGDHEELAPLEQPHKPRGNGAAFVPPDWVIVATWDAWVKTRPARARTPEALAAAIGKLEKLRAQGHDGNASIAESLANGWQGLFAPDQKRKGGTADPTLAERNRAAAAEFVARGTPREEKIVNDK